MLHTTKLLLILIPIAYLIGSIPFGLIIGLSRGIDPRKAGSGNIGATNVGRLLGGKYFAIVFTLDLLKSLIPMVIASILLHNAGKDWHTYLLWLLVGFAAILGHMFSLFLGFKGGKGVATSAGVLLGLFPYFTLPGLFAIGVWLILFAIWRYVSLASIFATLAFPIFYVLIGKFWKNWPVFDQQLPLLIFAILVALLIVYKHRGNIARLRAGTEHKIGSKQK
jgi:acyl phosphate:glycerol-3-phosphate acyltransferase